MSKTATDFGFGWDPTIQVGDIQEIAPPPPKVVADVVDEKIAFLQMQQAIIANQPENLKRLIAATPLKMGQQRALCRLTLNHFAPQLAEVLHDFPWSEVVKEEHMLAAVKKDQHDAFSFMLSYLNTYQFKRVHHHLMDVNANNFALYDKYRPAVFARLIPEHQQDVAKDFAIQLRSLKANKVEAHYNLAQSLAHLNWKDVFTSENLYSYTSIDETWGWGWLIKEFPSVRQQYNELAVAQTKMIEQISDCVEKIVITPIHFEDAPGTYRTRYPDEFFTEDFLKMCKKNHFDVDPVYRVIGDLCKLAKTHGVDTKEIVLTAIKNQYSGINDFSEALNHIYADTYKVATPLPLHMLSTPVEKILNNGSYTTSILRLLSSEDGRSALREYFKNPLYLRKFANQIINRKIEGPDLNKIIRNTDVFIDAKSNTLMHFMASNFFEKMDVVKQFVVNPKLNWEEKNSCGFSPKDIAYQHYGSFTQSLLDTAENIFNERANNILNKNLKQQLAHKAKPTLKRKM